MGNEHGCTICGKTLRDHTQKLYGECPECFDPAKWEQEKSIEDGKQPNA